MDLYDIAIARKLSGGGGGGGGGDFTVAKVTISNSVNDNIPMFAPFSTPYGTMGSQAAVRSSTKTFDVIMDSQYALLYFGDTSYVIQATASGNIEQDGEDFIITGDGTITIANA